MPLVVMCGFPASGKTTRCQQLCSHLSSQFPSKQVHVVNENAEGSSRNELYANSHKEREVRGDLKSSVQRLLSKDDVVILDSMNYIKGFRYELFCVTKSCRTPHCVIYCVTDAETSKSWNLMRAESEQFDPLLMDELIMRFECPSPNNRWDKPLFSVVKDEELDFATVCDALFEQKAPAPNQSTQSQPLSSTNFLYELDKRTQDIVTEIVSAQKTAVPGDVIKVADSKESITVTRTVGLSELQRHRRQFITYTKMHPVDDIQKLSSMFMQYLQKSLDN
ncbi:protein KTI12 homolog [Aplysia californica]|uniref:Protein KTI12 homolog n=1 Tax=Aplysia californica TaxID=6500 RepID=A0ABM0JHM5_APLCA|nr:protein KTI12 homolog [Aplysia californica]XP_035824490.1 protein KTI12 homolog [Aplysia californica]XP_035824491.1 protein KTI12 homolog [Aplysia californica]